MDRIFPDLEAMSLQGRRYRLPADLSETTVVILAFRRAQQSEVDEWIRELEAHGCPYPIVEVPTIGTRYRWIRAFIDGGMRAGIPDPAVRARTLTTYTSVPHVLAALGLSSIERVVVARVTPAGALLGIVQRLPEPTAITAVLGTDGSAGT